MQITYDRRGNKTFGNTDIDVLYLIVWRCCFSARYGKWHKDKSKDIPQKNVPRIMAFIMGGATYSEFRAGYEVSKAKNTTWEIFVGGSHILTPDGFLTGTLTLKGHTFYLPPEIP